MKDDPPDLRSVTRREEALASSKKLSPLKLYWVETPSAEENCFVVARSKAAAARYERNGSGFGTEDCVAEYLLTPDVSWLSSVAPDGVLLDEIVAFYAQPEDVVELGVGWVIMDGDDYFSWGEREFFRQGGMNWIASVYEKPRNIVIRSVRGLLEIVERDAPGEWLFRGQSSCRWGLQASVHRLRSADLGPSELRDYERRIVGEFRRRARSLLPAPPSTIWEWLVLAQHFGLPTRLLDWTENPLVALYLSVRDNDGVSDDGQIFAYRHGAPEIDLESTIDPFNIQRIEVVRPPYLDQRVIIQRSVFTVEPHPLECEDTESEDLRYWNVSGLVADEIREELASLGISESTLFPGLDTLAKDIKFDSRLW
ncbi:FRG domain-containing protein [Brevundimonas vesicularis]|uniref:FRG domain-containing protein n=1 Tax=Brevundimonas vesicularis TaxID=41276 RepID=A0ABU4KSK5_BREVE|nr:FRG domain-containing protein [Brevundimonas vesicularis]MDX2335866.1 FRG domain-containing protein [Brevundimonas vesicularis]